MTTDIAPALRRPPTSLSVIVSTRDRAESLRTTLQSLAAADRVGVDVDVIVVDNGSRDHTRVVADSFDGTLGIRCLSESTIGKCHALNRGVAAARGDVIAVLDDDMTVAPDWPKAVIDVCRRKPGYDIFGGSIEIEWPTVDVPPWATRAEIRGEIYSAEIFAEEADLEPDRWFSGNHFWFRADALALGVRFEDLWVTEARFQLDLVERGLRGIACPSATARHRIQPSLLRPDVALGRARQAGGAFARVRLEPYRTRSRRARSMRDHPWLSRAYCALRHVYYRSRYAVSCMYPPDSAGFADRVIALMWMTASAEYLRVAGEHTEYALWKRARTPRVAPS